MHDTDKSFSHLQSLMVQEEMLDTQKMGKQLKIGVIAESESSETRIPLTPEGIEQLVKAGHQVFVEKGAGTGSRFSSHDFSESGASVIDKKEKLFEADILLKISPLNEREIALLRGGQTLISSLYLATRDEAYFRSLMQKKTTAIAFELLQDDNNEFPVLRSMCEIAGTVSVGIGSRYLSTYDQGKGILLGGITGITPSEVLILGAGTASEYATRTALGMGALVKVFDNVIPRLRNLKQRVGQEVFTSVMHPPVLKKAFETADLVISTLQRLHHKSFYLVPEDLIMSMKKGSVVLDMHIDQGSSFETGRLTTSDNAVYREHGVIHYMVPNITAQVGRTASIALSNVLIPLLMDKGRCGGVQQQILTDYGVRQGVYLYNGILTHEMIGSFFKIPFQNIDLLLAAF
ncbi:MAG: alanine dehydrogenase [Bacteroidales bacterium]|nr:alanine dehydrogenase [Bacteroidales bacterium]